MTEHDAIALQAQFDKIKELGTVLEAEGLRWSLLVEFRTKQELMKGVKTLQDIVNDIHEELGNIRRELQRR